MPKAIVIRHYRPLTFACSFKSESVSPFPSLTFNKIFPLPPSQDALNELPDINTTRTIPKPRGEVGRGPPAGYKLKEVLGWSEGKYVDVQVRG